MKLQKSPPIADVLRATRVVLDDPEMHTPDVIKEITMTQSEPQENSNSYCCVVTLNDNNEGKENNWEDYVVLNSMPNGNSVGQENHNTDTMPCTIVNDISNNNNEEMDNTFTKRRKSKFPQDMYQICQIYQICGRTLTRKLGTVAKSIRVPQERMYQHAR